MAKALQDRRTEMSFEEESLDSGYSVLRVPQEELPGWRRCTV